MKKRVREFEEANHKPRDRMSEPVNGHCETVDAQLLRQPTVDMGTPIDLLNAAAQLVDDGGGVSSAGMPPLLCSELPPDDMGGIAVKTELRELKPVDSMPHLMPMISDTFRVETKDVDTEHWVPMVSSRVSIISTPYSFIKVV